MKILISTVLCFCLAGLFSYHKLQSWAHDPVVLPKSTILEFPSATSLAGLSRDLAEIGLVSNSFFFRLYVKFHQEYKLFRAGTYKFAGSVSPVEICNTILAGNVYLPPAYQIVIPEGFTVKQTVNRLVAAEVGTKTELQKLVKDRDFLKSMGIQNHGLEGYIYPATYSFHEEVSGREVIEKMVQTFWKRLPVNYVKRVKNEKNLTLYEAVTFASLIEMETQIEDEKPKIAEVIWRRLKAGEPIGIDASLIYGIKNYQGDIKWSHLKDRKNKYNTRIHKGLPPTPIGSPTASTLEVILNPTKKGYHFYVLKPDGQKRHHFSTTLSEHNRHVKLLIKSSRKTKTEKN